MLALYNMVRSNIRFMMILMDVTGTMILVLMMVFLMMIIMIMLVKNIGIGYSFCILSISIWQLVYRCRRLVVIYNFLDLLNNEN